VIVRKRLVVDIAVANLAMEDTPEVGCGRASVVPKNAMELQAVDGSEGIASAHMSALKVKKVLFPRLAQSLPVEYLNASDFHTPSINH